MVGQGRCHNTIAQPYQSTKRVTRKCGKLIAKNKVFEFLTLLKTEVKEYEKMGFKMAKWLEMPSQRNKFLKIFRGETPGHPNERGVEPPSHTLPPLAAFAARFNPSAFSAPRQQHLWVQPCFSSQKFLQKSLCQALFFLQK